MTLIFDDIADWTYGTVLSTDNATEFTLAAGQGALFPTPVNGYYAAVYPAGLLPLLSPSAPSASKQVEVFRINAGAKAGDVFTWSARNQLGTPTRTILAGDQVAAPLSAETIIALQNAANALENFAFFMS